MTAVAKENGLVVCDHCTLCRRFPDRDTARVLAEEHNEPGACPGLHHTPDLAAGHRPRRAS